MMTKLCYPLIGPESDCKVMALSGDFEANLEALHKIGYQGIELMIRDANKISIEMLEKQLKRYELEVAAIGVTPMVVQDKLTLANSDAYVREQALQRGLDAIALASEFNAPFCIGSFRGSIDESDKENNRGCAVATFRKICQYANEKAIQVLFEPQGVSNGNYLNTIDEGLSWIEEVGFENLKMILDMFHMAANEGSIFESIVRATEKFELVHACDSKRYIMGFGDLPIHDFLSTIFATGYQGYISTEVKQLPDSLTAAKLSYQYFEYRQKVMI